MMKQILKTGGLLLVVASWLALCGIALSAPTFVRAPLTKAIENLKATEMEPEAVATWDAVRPVSKFTKQLSDRVVLFSTLMFIGFISFAIGSKLETKPNTNLEPISGS